MFRAHAEDRHAQYQPGPGQHVVTHRLDDGQVVVRQGLGGRGPGEIELGKGNYREGRGAQDENDRLQHVGVDHGSETSRRRIDAADEREGNDEHGDIQLRNEHLGDQRTGVEAGGGVHDDGEEYGDRGKVLAQVNVEPSLEKLGNGRHAAAQEEREERESAEQQQPGLHTAAATARAVVGNVRVFRDDRVGVLG